jgi:hypothetical protein
VLATFAAAALIGGASALVGEAIARLLGLERGRGWSPAVGLAALLTIALGAVKLPGHGTTGAVILVLVVVAAAVVVLRRGGMPKPPPYGVALTVLAVAAACIPYLSNGRFGILALSFNNDLSAHIPWANWLQNPDMVGAFQSTPGYPVGPHSLVASLSSATGIDAAWCFMGLLLVLPALVAWAALPLLDGLGRGRKVLAALLVSLAYTVSALYVQAGFKELALTAFLLAMIGIARGQRGPVRPWIGVQLGLLGAGIVCSFSYGGLGWPVLTAAVWLGLAFAAALLRRPCQDRSIRLRGLLKALRGAVPALFVTLGTGALALALDAGRLIDSLDTFGTSPAATGSLAAQNIGHLTGPVPKREIFGFWPSEDFRFGFEQTVVSNGLELLAIAVIAVGGLWWLWRRDFAVPAAAAAALALLVYLGQTESAYTASKALAPAGALMMLVAVRPLLGAWSLPRRVPPGALRAAQAAIAVLFVGGALWSSYQVLRGAQVGPRGHGDELGELLEQVEGEPTLFLANDDFVRSELPGAELIVGLAGRGEKDFAAGDPLDFDSPAAADVERSRYVITPGSEYRSEPPAGFVLAGSTESFDLWRRDGPLPTRRTLDEGAAPGAPLDCSTAAGRRIARQRGFARVWTVPPIVEQWPDTRVVPLAGDTRGALLRLPRGRWELSLQYFAPQDVEVIVDGRRFGTLPASLDRIGPFWPIGELRQPRAGTRRLRLEIGSDPLGAGTHTAEFDRLAAVRTDAPHRTVPLSAACGRYVDWYTLGAAPRRGG